MSYLDQPGDLAQTPLAALLIEAINVRATGTLVVEHGGGTSKLYLRGGIPAGGQTFVGFRPLGQYLLSKGLIDIDALGRSLAEMHRTGKPQGEVLVEMGAVSRAAVDSALTEQQGGYITRIAALDSGAFRFDPAAIPEWTRTLRISSPLRAVVDALEKPQAAALVTSALQQVSATPVALGSGYAQIADRFGWTAPESELVSRLSRPLTVAAFFGQVDIAPERARAVLSALLLLGVAEPAAARASGAEEPVGLVVDLADLGGEPVPADEAKGVLGAASASPAPPSAAAHSDPAEARLRRQRLLARAMQNMGVGPLSRGAPQPQPPQPPADAPGPNAAEASLRRALEHVAPRAHDPDLFARMGLPRTASNDEVKQAYLALAKQFHPDRFNASALADLAPVVKDLFTAVNEAYEILSDTKKRKEYLARGAPLKAGGPPVNPAAELDFKKGEACAKTKDWVRARGFYEAAIRADARAEYQAALAWTWLADTHHHDRAKARKLLELALKDPRCDRALYVAAVVFREEGDEEKAERLFRACLKVNAHHTEAAREVRLADMRRQKKLEEAEKKSRRW